MKKRQRYECLECGSVVINRVKHLEHHAFDSNEIHEFESKVTTERFEEFMSKFFKKTNKETYSYSRVKKMELGR